METMTISKPGKTKQELKNGLKNLLEKYRDQIQMLNGKVTEISDGYEIKGDKFIFHVDAAITVDEETYMIRYYSNAPRQYIDKGLGIVKDTLENV